MPRPNIHTQIFLDSADPQETEKAIEVLGFLDGQTTNPSLLTKVPAVQTRMQTGQLLTGEELLGEYKKVVETIETINPGKPLSIQVYADETSTKDDLLIEVDEMNTWIDEPFIKLPLTKAGLETAEQCAADGIKVNMTLCFSVEQAVATYSATIGLGKNEVFLSPFVGRLEDQGLNGLDLIQNITELFKSSDHHVAVLAASIRRIDQLVACIEMESDAITAPLSLLTEWQRLGFPTSLQSIKVDNPPNLEPIPQKQYNIETPWRMLPIDHPQTKSGLEKFVSDWSQLISSEVVQ